MQSFTTFLSENRSMAVLVGLLAVVVVVVLALLLYRGLFGRRLHMAGSRSRQPRLGVVDAFDLDRQRQLVLVRRDNVEHLIMIGGPNDLVIESAFVRAQPTVQIPNGRDKEVPAPPPLVQTPPPVTATLSLPIAPPTMPAPPEAHSIPAIPMPAPEPEAATVPEPLPRRLEPVAPLSARGATSERRPSDTVSPGDLGPLADLPAPGPVSEPVSPVPAAPVAPTAPALVDPEPSPPAPAPPPRPAFSRQGLPPKPGAAALPPRAPLTTLRPPSTPPAPRPLPARPATPLQRGTSAASLRREPVPSAPGAAPSGGAMVPTPPTDTALPITLDSIESLEEEMAKLLGRASSDKR